ncbi:MAG TPA: peptidylprolyl isomerase, partial [Candidatus Krumholzibacterium sp.]|nr:peptidylprolyl isomerase [Candidatus Krumholzibacterium sp.]
QMYSMQYQQLMSQIRARRGENAMLSVTESHMLAEQAWETSIMEILREQEIKRLKITVNDDELVSFLRRNPHPQLQSVFVDEDGNFDYQEYLRQISNPDMDWTELEAWGRAELPRIKLESMLVSQISIPDRLVLEEFEKRTVTMNAQYVTVPWEVDEETPYEPSPEEISALYEEIKDDFMIPERRRVKLIRIEKAATDLDDQDVKTQLLEIRREIMEGDDFAESARIHSDDYMSAEKGGDLGFFGWGTMDSLFTSTAFGQDTGQVSMPVRTEFGYHLIRTEEKKKEDGKDMVRARHILMKVEPGYDTIDSLSTLLEDVRDAIRSDGFENGARSAGLEVIDAEPFTKGAFIRDFGYLPRVVSFAFNHKPGTISGGIEAEDAIYFVKVIGEIPEEPRPLEEVADQLVDRIRYDRKVEEARETAETIRQEANTSGDLEAVAHSRELPFAETGDFTFEDPIPGIGAGTDFAMACFKSSPDKITMPVRGSGAWYVIRVIRRSPADLTEFGKQKQSISNELMQESAYNFLADWYRELREKAVIKDEREFTLN